MDAFQMSEVSKLLLIVIGPGVVAVLLSGIVAAWYRGRVFFTMLATLAFSLCGLVFFVAAYFYWHPSFSRSEILLWGLLINVYMLWVSTMIANPGEVEQNGKYSEVVFLCLVLVGGYWSSKYWLFGEIYPLAFFSMAGVLIGFAVQLFLPNRGVYKRLVILICLCITLGLFIGRPYLANLFHIPIDVPVKKPLPIGLQKTL